jgi:hypothetical protein
VNWTEDQLTAYMAQRQAHRQAGRSVDVPDAGLESKLQARCIRYCKERGWPVWHDRSQKKNQPGWPDLVIFKPDGAVKLVELKAASGRLRREQEAMKRQFMFLGHEIRVVRSFRRFVEVVSYGDPK